MLEISDNSVLYKFPLCYYYYCHVSEQLGQSHQMKVEYPGVKHTTI